MEVTSEGLAQHRLDGVIIDCAVFTNLHREHLESHGSFENYLEAKQKLFLKTKQKQVLNIDDPYFEKFANFPALSKVTYGIKNGLINPQRYDLKLQLLGDFNEYNALASLAVADVYGLDMGKAVMTLNTIECIPGRMEEIDSGRGFRVIVDYAHTPDSLRMVYEALRHTQGDNPNHKMICVLGAAGGGRDKWKRPEFGAIAARYCDEIILTNEDPYDENPAQILSEIKSGISNFQFPISNVEEILDRGEAIKTALTMAVSGDIVIITGKGSETSMAVRDGRKIPWSDRNVVLKLIE
jgi:UDP-N-acetylmuramoyl-L-alanyl-D-glutamate--2,6-diaminopimelate ligase